MGKSLSAVEMIEADYRLLCEARKEAAAQSGNWKRRAFFYLFILLLLSFPVFF
jgi:type II secretory pathway component PulL